MILLLPTITAAYSINNIDCGTVKEGETVTKDLTISLTAQDSNSYFKIEKGGDIGSYLKVEPMEFELKSGQRKTLKVILITTGLTGKQNGWIIARGQEPIGEGQIGYTVSLKSNIDVNVVNEVLSIIGENVVSNNTTEDTDNINLFWFVLVGIICSFFIYVYIIGKRAMERDKIK